MKERPLKSLGALSIDINGLKNFNKEFGRDYGDEVVIRVGEVLQEYFHSGKFTALRAISILCSWKIRLMKILRNRFTHRIQSLIISVSDLYPWDMPGRKLDIPPDVEKLVNNAEVMMREEKKKYYKNLKKGHHEPIIKQDLLEDLERGNFIVCLVPKIDTETERVAEAEAVVRYHHKDLGIVDPGRYINLLEEDKAFTLSGSVCI